MLLLATMKIINIFSASAVVIQEYPYFSQEVRIDNQDEDANRTVENVNSPKPSRNMFITFDPASVRELKEFIWIDLQ